MKFFAAITIILLAPAISGAQSQLEAIREELSEMKKSGDTTNYRALRKKGAAWKNDLEKADIYMAMGELEELRLNRPDIAIDYYSQAIDLYQAQSKPGSVASAYRNLAFAAMAGADFHGAIDAFDKAREGYLQAGDTAMAYGMINNVGSVYIDIGETEKAKGLLLQAAEDCPRGAASLKCADVVSNLARVFLITGEYEKGISWAVRSLPAYREAEDHNKLANVYNTISGCFFHLHELDSSEQYLQRAAAHYQESGNLHGHAQTTNNQGSLAIKQKDYQAAAEYLSQSLESSRRLQHIPYMANAYTNLAEANFYLGRKSPAFRYLDSARQIALSSKQLMATVYEVESRLQEESANFSEALQAYKTYQAYQDSLQNEARSATYAELETRYETAVKDQQLSDQALVISEKEKTLQQTVFIIALLTLMVAALAFIYFLAKSRQQKERQLLLQQKEIEVKEAYIHAALESQERERKRFAQDLHDGFGQLISALKINISNLTERTEPEAKAEAVEKSEQVLAEMHKEIRNVAFNLMPATLIQYGLKEAVDELTQRLNTGGKIHIELDAREMEGRLDELQEISLYRVIQEWLNNVVKYAGATRVTVQLVRHDDELSIVIEDDGQGFDVQLLEQSRGHGWRNIRSRLSRIKASVDIDTRPGRKGSSFIISLPLFAGVTVAGKVLNV